MKTGADACSGTLFSCKVWEKFIASRLWGKVVVKLMDPFYGCSSTASRLEPLRGGSLLFTTKFPDDRVLLCQFIKRPKYYGRACRWTMF